MSQIENDWTWEKRLKWDQDRHLKNCQVCRTRPELEPREMLFAMKNSATREFLHVVAHDTREALHKLKWSGLDLLYSIILDTGTHGSTMSEETKARLREINLRKRAERQSIPRLVRVNPNARHLHECIDCKKEFFHVDPACLDMPQLLRCIECGTKFGNKKGLLTGLARRGKVTGDQETDKGEQIEKITQKGGGNTMNIKDWTKEFIEGQVFEKGEKGEPVLNSDSLFKLAKANDVDATKFRKDFKPANAGRIRMTIGNMLRGAAVRNKKLVTLGGASKLVPDALLPAPKVKKVAKKKAAKNKKKST